MTKSDKPDLSPAEQDLLDHVTVRLIRPEERATFDELLVKEHYLHNAELVGEQLRYVAEYDKEWLALLTWNAAAFNLRLREAWIGWTPQQKKRRLTLVVNNSRFVVRVRVPNLASRVMKGCLQRVSSDWLRTYGHEVLVAESFVDPQLFRGTCYKASGWTLLGQTPAQMGALRFPPHGHPRRYSVPKETTFFRLLSHLDSPALEQALLDWLNHVLGPPAAQDDQVSGDGKELLSSQGVQIVRAYAVKSGRWLGSERIAEGSNEIPAAQALLRRAPIEGKLLTLDALHTQTETARIIVQERGADYLMTVKGNQPGVAETIQPLYERCPRAFF